MPLIESFSGIRGIFGKELTEDIARRYAFCFYSFLKGYYNKEPKIILGYDPRQSSDKIRQSVLAIFNYVIDVGINTTPIVEFAVRKFKADGAVMITASHNEPKYNGFKFMSGSGAVLRPSEMAKVIEKYQEIKDITEVEFFEEYLFKDVKGTAKKDGINIHRLDIRHQESIDRFKEYLKLFMTANEIRKIKNSSPRIVLDPNGGSGILAKEILESFGIKVIAINTRYGAFKRVIEPNEKSLKYLKDYIRKNKALFAAGFDCDADRVEIVLKDGSIVNGNYILAMAVDEVLSNIRTNKKVNVVVSDATSSLVKSIVENYDGILNESETGEINVLDKMLEYEAYVGGEGTSAGVIVPPNRCRDGILTLLIILKMTANRDTSIESIIKIYPKYFSAAAKIRFKQKNHDSIKGKIKSFYLNKGFKIQETGDITGGLKIWINKDNFVFYRASKTEPNTFRIITDAKTRIDSKNMLKDAIRVFNRFK